MLKRRTHQAESATRTQGEHLLYAVSNVLVVLGFLLAVGSATVAVLNDQVNEGVFILLLLAAAVGANVLDRKLVRTENELDRERYARVFAEHTVWQLRRAESALLRDIRVTR